MARTGPGHSCGSGRINMIDILLQQIYLTQNQNRDLDQSWSQSWFWLHPHYYNTIKTILPEPEP
eukprot:601912-Pyramimonas_sp.AAC.1